MSPHVDRNGQIVSTQSVAAVARYDEGVERLVGSSPDAIESFRAAVSEDEMFGVALAAMAWSTVIFGADNADALRALERYLLRPATMTRRERQHVEVVALAVRGDVDRARALGRDHVREFPQDAVVACVVCREREPRFCQ
jgi:DNA-binding GntR family transcriptional regulator